MNVTIKPQPFKLTAPPLPDEHAIQRQINDVLRLEIAPAAKVSIHGVCWYGIDHALYGGAVPGTRLARGIVAGIPDLFFLYFGKAFFIELKRHDGQLSEPQRSVISAIIASGGQVGIARSADEVLLILDRWNIPRAHRINPPF
jgi:hypothetical protein